MTITDDADLKALKAIGAVVAAVRDRLIQEAQAGVTTRQLDDLAAEMLEKAGAQSAPIKAYNFPGHTCISVGVICAHGIPSDEPLRPGDLVNVDVSAERAGYWADTGASFLVPGRPVPRIAEQIEATRKAQYQGMMAARAGQPLNAIAKAIEKVAARASFTVVDELNGHGIGGFIHEEPTVYNRYYPSERQKLHKGQVIAIEPFFTPGNGQIMQLDDGWSLATVDGTPATQIEHSIVVTDRAPIVLTASAA